MHSAHNKILARIYGHGRGWVFSKIDFVDMASEIAVRKILSRLCDEGKIRRVARGLYDYPEYSDLLKANLAPGADEAARALARKYSWRIQPSGAAAANYFGVSTQVPGRILYYSDGPDRICKVDSYSIEFKRTPLKESGFRLPESGLLVQAIKEMGSDHIGAEVLSKIRSQIRPELFPRIIKETKCVAGWVYEAIRRTCEQERER